ncbi:DNA methyltransferase [uncultured Caulobacter sp.]|uniref:DNA methyltransferase n=1 Tax=uncultured Caulobacter sp. TaxID=158749 RepID=UPI0026022CCD|nr:DNA methyltransferase [uncultured Caulobacter sp.]
MAKRLCIVSPKRNKRLQTGWEGFFPYYAGYPELFARELLKSAKLPHGAVVLDPWNGSGTTTYTATTLGLNSIGIDLNPVMIIVARARLLPPSEADHLRPLAATILSHAHSAPPELAPDDALLSWFDPATAAFVRGIEQNIRRSLVGSMTKSPDGVHLDRISGTAATLYVALFAACRRLVAPFRSSNPTWLRAPKADDARIAAPKAAIARDFGNNVRGMTAALVEKREADQHLKKLPHPGDCKISLSDTVAMELRDASVDFVLTSPPYCTRIDYTAATRIELAVLAPLLKTAERALGRQMIGSTQVPKGEIELDEAWGKSCLSFLAALKAHPSKASGGYYYRTHLDYFDKMNRSVQRLARSLKPGGRAVLVVQDSYYKDIHNDLPKIITEIGAGHGLTLAQSASFHLRSMSDVNPGRKTYVRPSGATESVLCFRK